ncbi:MAG: HDIG domain-containing protein [Candidatus Omnitrophica bacterium]|nr:HDIG domain-containing protein [Candidatus Omnitrophota bacterium]MBU1133885.1 HDIG domain-containing protein [Candidatus Omnitrophota bacterium]MBU1367420.1 HDIG domain-containing protein [Candidatus Omnitrophota bacterium]MBU1524255.1 HDIG domain-containing protein [Candidatus Omnitrophota bacterium]MBU1810668.1 HDIG domain-containing protein [Candidatus Omnitrophota bacterium]
MKVSIKKFPVNLNNLLSGIIFFIVVGFIFFIYSIDFSSLILAVVLIAYAKFLREMEGFPSYINLSLIGMIAILSSLFTVLYFKISPYGIPAIGFAILVTILFGNLEFSLIFSLFISFLGASIDGGNFNLGVSLLIGSLVAAIFSLGARHRHQVIKAGLLGGAAQFITAFIMEREQSFFFLSSLDFSLFTTCILSGFVSSIVVVGVLPIFEYIFKVVTNISLLELSDFNHPLLRRFILEAPGSYQHSLVVANLSEAAAESIGANSLLTRVGAYYHDIGKLIKPEYFVENRISYKDIHKDLKPSMSKLIIINHIKEGVELARKYRLNPRIIDFITQHHGLTLVHYFYQKALGLKLQGENKEEYRYPGPKPQSKEIAIVALADSIEALSRLLEEPTPSRIKEMVREVVKKRFMEGELDESHLTLKGLEKITQSFTHLLSALFHTRINYPKDDRNNKSAKDKEDKS